MNIRLDLSQNLFSLIIYLSVQLTISTSSFLHLILISLSLPPSSFHLF